SELDTILKRVQHELFNVGSILATLLKDVHPRQPRVTQAEITQLEKEIDRMNEGLPELRSFVLPGGCRLNAELHVCRTVCRRADRGHEPFCRSTAARMDGVSSAAGAHGGNRSDCRWVQQDHTVRLRELSDQRLDRAQPARDGEPLAHRVRGCFG